MLFINNIHLTSYTSVHVIYNQCQRQCQLGISISNSVSINASWYINFYQCECQCQMVYRFLTSVNVNAICVCEFLSVSINASWLCQFLGSVMMLYCHLYKHYSSLQESCKRHGTQLLECSIYSIPQQILGIRWLPNDL